MGTIKLFLIDGHQLLVECWVQLLQSKGLDVVGYATDASMAASLVETVEPDIVVLDIAMTPVDGFAVLAKLAKLPYRPAVIGLSLYAASAVVKRFFQAGGNGYVTKNSPAEELLQAIEKVYRGDRFICQEVKDQLADRHLQHDELAVALERLSKREWQVIQQVKLGHSSKEIGALLKVHQKTIEVHRYNIFKKLHLRNRAELVNVLNARGL